MKKQSSEQAKKDILALFERSKRPVLLGRATIHLGPLWSLMDTEAIFVELEKEGRIREVSEAEQVEFGIQCGYRLV